MKKQIQPGPLTDLENAALAAKYGLPPKDPDIGIEITPAGKIVAHRLAASKTKAPGALLPPDLDVALSAADKAFADTQDGLAALGWVALAAKAGQPIPPHMAKWLHGAIRAYQGSDKLTLESALGLSGQGKANPKRKARERAALDGDLARMSILHTLGATIPQAAAMVAEVFAGQLKADTLADRYARSGSGKTALRDRKLALINWHWTEVENMLAEYPDRGQLIAEGKAAIRDRYEIDQPKRAVRAMFNNQRL